LCTIFYIIYSTQIRRIGLAVCMIMYLPRNEMKNTADIRMVRLLTAPHDWF